MGVSTIDGTLEEAVLRRAVGNIRIYDRLKFRLADGGEKSVAKSIVDGSVGAHLVPGASGRFYLFTAFDHRGLHGIRDTGGHAVFGYPRNNEKAMLISAIMGLVLIVLTIIAFGGLSFLGLGVMILGIIGYVLTRRTRAEATAQFEADSAWRAPAAAPAEA
jgi:hypothetical protein